MELEPGYLGFIIISIGNCLPEALLTIKLVLNGKFLFIYLINSLGN